jgi:glycosyltransferase involved in cell wall biosynthesis
MATGCAVIGTDSGGTAELLADGRGWTFPAGDSDALANALLTLRNHPDVLAPRRSACAPYIEHHRREKLVERWLNMLTQVGAE